VTDSTNDSPETDQPQPEPKRRDTWQKLPDVSTIHTPVTHRFDPPLEYRPYEEILAEVQAASAAIEKRRFGRKKAK
jgi:hypothetical protein